MDAPRYSDDVIDAVMDAWATPAQLTLDGAGPVEIEAVLRGPQGVRFTSYEHAQQVTDITLRARWSDIGTAQEGDTVTQNGVVYEFAEVPDHNGYGIGEARMEVVTP